MIKQYSNNCDYNNTLKVDENYPSEKGIAMTRFLPSTGYSLLRTDGANRDTKDGYCALDRSRGRVRPKKNQREVQDGYSKLSYKTV